MKVGERVTGKNSGFTDQESGGTLNRARHS